VDSGTDKNMLLGHDDNAAQGIGRPRVTYHHNVLDGTDQRDRACASATPPTGARPSRRAR
jgi:hypothetical protein